MVDLKRMKPVAQILSLYFRFQLAKLLFLFVLLQPISNACAQNSYTTITGVDVFDGLKLHQNVNFTFSESGIISIDSAERTFQNAIIIDGSGKTIVPPLVNAHVHIANAQNLKEGLQVGIFAMLDMFSLDHRAYNLRKYNDSLTYGRFYSSNVGATVPGGHGTEYRVKIPTINDTVSAREFVNDRLKMNADYIKISQEHLMALLSDDQLRDVIDETHKNNKVAVAHISAYSDALQLAELHVDGLAHIWYLNSSVSDIAGIAAMKRNGIFIIPTLSVIEKLIQNADSAELTYYHPLDKVFGEVRKAYNAGIPILAGTDARNFGMNYTTQFFDELNLLSKCGIPEIEILKAATTNIYRAFRLEGFGLLEANAPANFVLIDGKPHLNIADMYHAKRVWKTGIEITAKAQ